MSEALLNVKYQVLRNTINIHIQFLSTIFRLSMFLRQACCVLLVLLFAMSLEEHRVA